MLCVQADSDKIVSGSADKTIKVGNYLQCDIIVIKIINHLRSRAYAYTAWQLSTFKLTNQIT